MTDAPTVELRLRRLTNTDPVGLEDRLPAFLLNGMPNGWTAPTAMQIQDALKHGAHLVVGPTEPSMSVEEMEARAKRQQDKEAAAHRSRGWRRHLRCVKAST